MGDDAASMIWAGKIRGWYRVLAGGGGLDIAPQPCYENSLKFAIVRYVNGLGPDPSCEQGRTAFEEVTQVLQANPEDHSDINTAA